jgi:hypothetical protein
MLATLGVACAALTPLRELPLSGATRWRPLGGATRCRPSPRRAAVLRMADDDDAYDDDASGELARASDVNRYVDAVKNISAPELIRRFADSAPAEVQQAVRQTVVSLLGNMPPDVYDMNVMSTGQNVASLMYSMQSALDGGEAARPRAAAVARPTRRTVAPRAARSDGLHVPQRRVPPQPARDARGQREVSSAEQ